MNFFEAQERARKSSRALVWWFALSLLGVIAVMYVLVVLGQHYGNEYTKLIKDPSTTITWWDPSLLLWVGGIVGGVIVTGSLVKLTQLSAGGKVVAQDLGGRQVEPNTTDLAEKRLLNVVEEMAIASGLPVPQVWIMDEERGINAFAAGTDPTNAVIGVTRGTLDRLSRSELQGVVAHEFSHILNGDMKLNMHLMGWIFGLVMLSMLGRIMLESLRFIRGSRDSKEGGNGIVFAIFAAGLAVWLVGSVGVFFARMLQSAISRQREYLADASAVQFTRDSQGIAGALKKIGGFSMRSNITSPKAMEASHMFFAGCGLSALMSTHPPLVKRILAIDPQWNGDLRYYEDIQLREDDSQEMSGFAPIAVRGNFMSRLTELGESAELDANAGGLIWRQLQAGNVILASKEDAKLLLLGLLVSADSNDQGSAGQIFLQHSMSQESIAQLLSCCSELSSYESSRKLALIDLALPWLRKMNREEAQRFVSLSQALIDVDGEVNLFEFLLQKVIERHVLIGLAIQPVPKVRYRKLAELETELSHLLSVFTVLAGDENAIQSAATEYREHSGSSLPVSIAGLGEVACALREMDAATPLVKQQILRLCGLVVMHDGMANDQEIELLRATAEAIGAVIPPIVTLANKGGE